MSMYSNPSSDVEDDDVIGDEDDVDDEELIRLVDQVTNEETASLTDEPITVEEKVLAADGSKSRVIDDGDDRASSELPEEDASGEPSDMFKLVLAGNAAVGKSSFILRLCKNKFYSALNATLGEFFYSIQNLFYPIKNVLLQSKQFDWLKFKKTFEIDPIDDSFAATTEFQRFKKKSSREIFFCNREL